VAAKWPPTRHSAAGHSPIIRTLNDAVAMTVTKRRRRRR
jgi:hypothetical protein